jgi:galactose dehydrogenase
VTPNARFADLRGASVFITGGGSGIGAALSEGFVAQGAKVAFIQRSDAGAFCDRVEARHGVRPLFIQGDITDTPALQRAIEQAGAAHGAITVLVNNAANDARHSTQQVDETYWDQCMAVNLKAYFFAAQAVIAGMRAAGGGAIVNFSSISYMMGNAGYPLYTTANAGITGMTRSLAREFGVDKIRVNAIAPGWVMTDKQREMWVTKDALAGHLERQCLKRELQPKDIVPTALFLASKSSDMLSGQVIAVDGGVVVTG